MRENEANEIVSRATSELLRLQARVAELETALRTIATPTGEQFTFGGCAMSCAREARRIAKTALGDTE